MSKKAFHLFDEAYQEAVRKALEHFTPTMQEHIRRHNYGWRAGATDFPEYLRASSVRFYHAYEFLAQQGGSLSVCDVGGFWGVFPMTLAKLGFNVTMTETLGYYGDVFDPLFGTVRAEGVEVIDYDPFTQDCQPPGSFDFITAMAIIEHYPHSLKAFMTNMKLMLRRDGRLYLEVPNIASWPKRLAMARGQTPLTPIADIYRSEVPFVGHHHEFTLGELRELVRIAGLSVVAEKCYRFPSATLTTRLRRPLESAVCLAWPDCREIISALCADDGTASDNRP